MKVPIIGISRHRLLTDGEGVTTLVAFHGCPLGSVPFSVSAAISPKPVSFGYRCKVS